MREDCIVLIVSILSKVCDCSFKEYLFKLLNLLLNLVFFNYNLRFYFNWLFVSRMFFFDIVVFLRNVVKIMNELL